VDEHFLIGVSARTNEQGAEQLAACLRTWNYTASIIDIRADPKLLHLKTGIAYLGEGVGVVLEGESGAPFRDVVVVSAQEGYAANCVRINDAVLLAAGYPRVQGRAGAKRLQTADPADVRVQKDGRRLELPVAAFLITSAGSAC
jgi:dimethylargininase